MFCDTPKGRERLVNNKRSFTGSASNHYDQRAAANDDKGEPSEILLYITYLLSSDDIRRLLYVILICIWLLPLTAETFDVVFHTTNLHKNSFCVDKITCTISLIEFAILSIGNYIQFYLIIVGKTQYTNILRLSYIMQYIGMIGISAVMMLVTLDINIHDHKHIQPNTTCFKLDDFPDMTTHVNDTFCRISYFGNYCIGLILLVILHLDIWFKDNHFMIRVMCASIGIVTSSGCIVSNLFVNKKFYSTSDGWPLTITCYYVCVIGYSLIIVSITTFLPYLLIPCFNIHWKHKSKIGKCCSILLLLGLFGIQVRTYTMHWMFTLIGLLLVVDIQVLSLQ
eukprot:372097_1